MADIVAVCRVAWNASKKPTQPEYDELIESYRGMLLARAEKAIREGVTSGDALDGFEQAVIAFAEKPTPVEPLEDVETARLERAHQRKEAQPKPKKKATPKPAPKPKVKVVKKAAKKVAVKK